MISKAFAILLLSLFPAAFSVQAQVPPEEVEIALQDLGARLQINLSLNDFSSWTWREEVFNDASLGCPQEGESYQQLITRAYIVTFVLNETTYDYRVAGNGTVVICSPAELAGNTSTPVVVIPGRTSITAETVSQLHQIGVLSGSGFLDIAWSPENSYLAASNDAGLVLYNTESFVGSMPFETTANSLSLQFSPDGSLLASGDDDFVVRLWDIRESQLFQEFVMSTEQYPDTLSFSPDGNLVAASGRALGATVDNVITVWQVYDGATRYLLQGHNAPVNDITFSPDGTLLASASNDGTTRLWDLRNGEQIAIFNGGGAISFNHTGNLLALGRGNDTYIYDISIALLTGESSMTLNHAVPVSALDFSHDSGLIAVGTRSISPDGSGVSLWDIRSGLQLMQIAGVPSPVNRLSFNRAGTLFAINAADEVRIYSIN